MTYFCNVKILGKLLLSSRYLSCKTINKTIVELWKESLMINNASNINKANNYL